MRKFSFILAALAILGVACNKQETPENTTTPEEDAKEMVRIELKVSVDPETRATMDGLDLKFGVDDQISVLGTSGSTTNIYYLTYESKDPDTGVITFSTTAPANVEIGDYAYYPSDIMAPSGSDPIDPLLICWPSMIYCSEGVKIPMIAPIDLTNNTAEFKHLGAMLKVNLTNTPADFSWLEFRTSAKFGGWYEVNPSDFSMNLVDDPYNLNWEVIQGIGDGVYYIPIPAGSYSNFQLGMMSEDPMGYPYGYCKQRTTDPQEFSSITLTRGLIVNLGTFDYDIDAIEEFYLVCKANNWNYSDKTIRMIKCGENEYIAATWNGKWVSDSDDSRGFKIATASSTEWSKVYGSGTQYQGAGSMTLGGNYNGLWANSNNLYSATFNSNTKEYSTADNGNGDGYKYTTLALTWDSTDNAMTITNEGTHHWKLANFDVLDNSEHKFFIKNTGGWPRCSNSASVSDSAPYCAVGSFVESATDNECKAVLTPGKYDVYYNDITGNIMFVKQ